MQIVCLQPIVLFLECLSKTARLETNRNFFGFHVRTNLPLSMTDNTSIIKNQRFITDSPRLIKNQIIFDQMLDGLCKG